METANQPLLVYQYITSLQPAPTTETEVFLTIFDYIDRLFAMVRPRKLLHMAIGEFRSGAEALQDAALTASKPTS